jgi:hypothetical protein
MNRLSPLISRSFAPSLTPAAAIGAPVELPWDGTERRRPTAADDLRLFVTAWLGGLIFFGTLLA